LKIKQTIHQAFALSLLCSCISFSQALAAEPESSLVLFSQPGDYIGQGKDIILTEETHTFTAGPNYRDFNRGVNILVRWAQHGSWNLNFDTGNGTPLEVGHYQFAKRFPFNDQSPGLSITGEGRGCNKLEGKFTVLEIKYSEDKKSVVKFSADFEQHCEGLPAALFGSIRFVDSASYACNPAELDSLRSEVEELRQLTVDSDSDDIPNIFDICPGTHGEEIDSQGCSQQKFCERHTRRECSSADWQNDHPRGRSGDCRFNYALNKCASTN
jgi:hypothetical protein